MELRNTREGYEPENARTIPDDVDHGAGFSAGDRVEIDEEDPVFPGEEGEVYAVCYDAVNGGLVVDVMIDGTDEPNRFPLDSIVGTA